MGLCCKFGINQCRKTRLKEEALMSKRSRPYNNGGGVMPTPKIPLRGALTVDDSENSLALKMLVEQIQAYQQQTLLELQTMAAILGHQTEQVKALQTEVAAVKRDAAEGLAETRTKMQKLMEQKPTDPRALQAMLKESQAQATKEMHKAETRFAEALKTMPRADLNNDTGETVRLIANGVSQILYPGINHNIPQAFIDHWEKRKDEKRWADGLNTAFLARDKEGDFMGAGYYQNILGGADLTLGE